MAQRRFPGPTRPGPAHLEPLRTTAELVTQDDATSSVPCGPDVEPILKSVRQYRDAGYDHLYFHQIGPDQHGVLDFWTNALQPAVADLDSP